MGGGRPVNEVLQLISWEVMIRMWTPAGAVEKRTDGGSLGIFYSKVMAFSDRGEKGLGRKKSSG